MGSLLVTIPIAIIVGLIIGSLGGGGAILTVPILVYLLHQPPSAATAGSLIVVTLASLAGLVGHARKGNVRWRDGLIFGVAGVVGSLGGSALSRTVPAHVLMTAFGVLMLAVAGLMFQGRKTDGEGERRGILSLVVAATIVGFLTGFFGVGGGFAVVPALVLVLGFSMPVAVATSLFVIVINSLVALGSRVAGGAHVDWPLILTFSACAAVGSILGGRITSRVPGHILKRAFGVLLLGVAAYVLSQNVPQLL